MAAPRMRGVPDVAETTACAAADPSCSLHASPSASSTEWIRTPVHASPTPVPAPPPVPRRTRTRIREFVSSVDLAWHKLITADDPYAVAPGSKGPDYQHLLCLRKGEMEWSLVRWLERGVWQRSGAAGADFLDRRKPENEDAILTVLRNLLSEVDGCADTISSLGVAETEKIKLRPRNVVWRAPASATGEPLLAYTVGRGSFARRLWITAVDFEKHEIEIAHEAKGSQERRVERYCNPTATDRRLTPPEPTRHWSMLPDFLQRGRKPAQGRNKARCMGITPTMKLIQWMVDHFAVRVIVDPFCGAGTVLACCGRIGVDSVGCDLSLGRVRQARALVIDESFVGRSSNMSEQFGKGDGGKGGGKGGGKVVEKVVEMEVEKQVEKVVEKEVEKEEEEGEEVERWWKCREIEKEVEKQEGGKEGGRAGGKGGGGEKAGGRGGGKKVTFQLP